MLGDHVATEVEQWRRARALLPVALGGREDPTAEGAPDEGGNHILSGTQRRDVKIRLQKAHLLKSALRGHSEAHLIVIRSHSEALRGHSEAFMRADR